ncbi:MAG: type II toxin-antitoxin system HicB family antitoxin, partial [Deltaproteobacteria bacterium]|nr:type II toxin-antitoxin system HicB family antitoxin [Deltaproteobacteria bacterium]
MERMTCNAIVWQENGVYFSECAELGITGYGFSVSDAVEDLKRAIKEY